MVSAKNLLPKDIRRGRYARIIKQPILLPKEGSLPAA